MKKFLVSISWTEPHEDSIEIEAEDENSAIDQAGDELGVGEDWHVDSCVMLSSDDPEDEKPYIDPNQLVMEFA